MKKIATTDQVIGLVMWILFELVTKLKLYPYLTDHYSFYNALIICFLFNFIFRYSMIIVYDLLKRDFFLIEFFKLALEQGEEMPLSSFMVKKILWFKRIGGEKAVFLGLFCIDPFMFVLFYRERNYAWNNITSIKLFFLYLGSTIFCSSTIMGLVKLIIDLLKSIF